MCVKKVGPFTQTVHANQSSPTDSMFMPDWSRDPSIIQHQSRVIAREMQGQKLTPVGRTVLRKTRVSRS